MITAIGSKRIRQLAAAVFAVTGLAAAVLLAGCGDKKGKGEQAAADTSATAEVNAAETDAVDTGAKFADSRDGKEYRYVKIGRQVWMAENLSYNAKGSKCYENSPDSCAKYGRLYDWKTAMNGAASSELVPSNVQGVCPAGWHIPSDREWTRFENYLGGAAAAGRKLKSKTGWNYDGSDREDEYGFSALPGGGFNSQGGYFYGADDGANWRTATEFSDDEAFCRCLSYADDFVRRFYNDKNNMYSVRCVKDEVEGPDPAYPSELIGTWIAFWRQQEWELLNSGEYIFSQPYFCGPYCEAEGPGGGRGTWKVVDKLLVTSFKFDMDESEAVNDSTRYRVSDSGNVLELLDKDGNVGGKYVKKEKVKEFEKRGLLDAFVDERDNVKYGMKKIGGQVWMRENLMYEADGSKCYEDDRGKCNEYGRLYNWEAAKKACPAGWHLPSDAEWTALENYAGGRPTAGKALKSAHGWNKDGNGTDEYGFSALPGGIGYGGGGFHEAGKYGSWWSATEHSAGGVGAIDIFHDIESVRRKDGNDKTALLSVRCLLD